MEIIIFALAFSLIITAGLLGANYAASQEKAKRIYSLESDVSYWRENLHQQIYKTIRDTEIERKLWVNKALVRGGADKIFDDAALGLPPKLIRHTPLIKPENDSPEILPPYTAQLRNWEAADKEKTKSVIPQERRDEILKAIEELSPAAVENN